MAGAGAAAGTAAAAGAWSDRGGVIGDAESAPSGAEPACLSPGATETVGTSTTPFV